MSFKYLTDAQVREIFGDITPMTLWRWRHAIPPKPVFPMPIRINGRNYNSPDPIADWVQAQEEADNLVHVIPNAENGRVKGREKLDKIIEAKKASPELIDQLGLTGGPPLDDAVEQSEIPITKVGNKEGGGDNG